MGCHTIVAAAKPEIQKLAKYAAAKKPVPWVRIHKVPDYVHFPHVRHVNAGVTCQTCHGQVQKMAQVYQYASLNMGWCVNCHVNGYDPKEGMKAAGYDNVTPAGYSGGVPFGTPGSRAGIEVSPPGLAVRPDTAHPAAAAAPAEAGALNRASTPSVERRRARYDCASCHY
jgi:hypothetical protein